MLRVMEKVFGYKRYWYIKERLVAWLAIMWSWSIYGAMCFYFSAIPACLHMCLEGWSDNFWKDMDGVGDIMLSIFVQVSRRS
jgi:hypothetical protein